MTKHNTDNSRKLIFVLIIVTILFAVAFVVSLESAWNPVFPFKKPVDGSVFEYVAKVMLYGGNMYKDTFDHKGPLLYFFNCLGIILHSNGIWIIEYIALVITSVLVYSTFRLLSGKFLSCIGTVYILLFISYYICQGNFSEEFSLPFVVCSLYIFAKYYIKGVSNIAVIICGFCCGCTFLLRQNLIAIWCTFCIYILYAERHNLRKIRNYVLFFLLGVLLIFLPVFLYLCIKGILCDFWKEYFLFNFLYSSGGLQDKFQVFLNFFLSPQIIFTVFSILYLIFLKKYRELCIVNLVFQFVNIVFLCVAGRNYPHYKLLLPTGCIVPLMLFLNIIKQNTNKTFLFGALFFIAIYFFSGIFISSLVSFTNEQINFSKNMNLNDEYLVADIIKNNTSADDKILVLGNCDTIYLLSDRYSLSKYSYQCPIIFISNEIYKEFISDINEHLPKVVVIDKVFWNYSYYYNILTPDASKYIDYMYQYLDDNSYKRYKIFKNYDVYLRE